MRVRDAGWDQPSEDSQPRQDCEEFGSREARTFGDRTLDGWGYAHGVTLRIIRPGKPIENAYVESFNGKSLDECLNEYWFLNLVDAKTAIEGWRVDYNTVRPHSSLDQATPDQFAKTTEGARRLPPARLSEEPTPEDLLLSPDRM